MREGLITSNSVRFLESALHGRLVKVNVRGRVVTANGAEITVNKWLKAQQGEQGRDEVKTSEYDYHAIIRHPDGTTQSIFRYDNCHGDVETLHRHHYDIDGDEDREHEEAIAHDAMPVLDVVIREADDLAAWLAALARN